MKKTLSSILASAITSVALTVGCSDTKNIDSTNAIRQESYKREDSIPTYEEFEDRTFEKSYREKIDFISKHPEEAFSFLTKEEKEKYKKFFSGRREVPSYSNLDKLSPEINWDEIKKRRFEYSEIDFNNLEKTNLLIFTLDQKFSGFPYDGDIKTDFSESEYRITIPLFVEINGKFKDRRTFNYPLRLGEAKYLLSVNRLRNFAYDLPNDIEESTARKEIDDFIRNKWLFVRASCYGLDGEKGKLLISKESPLTRLVNPIFDRYTQSKEFESIKEGFVKLAPLDKPDVNILFLPSEITRGIGAAVVGPIIDEIARGVAEGLDESLPGHRIRKWKRRR